MLDRSIFHDIPGYEDRFQINLNGEVRSKSRFVNSPIAGGQRLIQSKPIKICLIKGYPGFGTSVEGKRVTIYIHRALALLFIRNPENKPDINHIDGNKANFALSNLEWCTRAENMRHAFSTGLATPLRQGKGEKCTASKLTESIVRDIKASLRVGDSAADLARLYGVAKGTIGHIRHGRTWSHIQ